MIHLTAYKTVCTHNTELLDDITYPQRVHWFPELYSRVKNGLTYVPHKLAERVMPGDLLAQLRKTPCKTAFIFASGNSHLAGLYNPGPTPPSRLTYGYKFLPLTLTQVYAGRMAQTCGASDLVMTDASACASSLKALTDVYQLITYQNFDRVIVLSVEDVISDKVLGFFGETNASLTYKQEQTGVVPSAFDKQNFGFYLGQGAVFAVFESNRVAQNSHARLIGAGIASEVSSNAIGEREDGQGFVRAAKNALRTANIGSEEIQIVKTHGTGTKSNNLAEKAALQTLLHTPFIATSFKQKIGHTMGASGLLETCLLLDSLQSGVVPSIPNRTEHDPVFLSEPQIIKRSPKILSLAAGMGNIYAAAIFDTKV
jgi:3-oxoacyl-(acyl-carrier-protein) synthase